MKAKLSPCLAAAACALLAACSSGGAASSSRPPATASATAASAACSTYLDGLYRQLGGSWGAGRFQAAVNAEAAAGTLSAACAGITNTDLMRLAARAAGGE